MKYTKLYREQLEVFIKVRDVIYSYDGWFWDEEVVDAKKIKETIESYFFCENPYFEYIALEILQCLGVIDECYVIQTDVIQFKGNIWCDEEEYLSNVNGDGGVSFDEYLECEKWNIFYELKELLIDELKVVYSEKYKDGANKK